MFRHYRKTYRIKVPEVPVRGKHCLSKDEVKRLLGATVVIEEKLDGANSGVIRHKSGFSLQKKGSLVGQSEHLQFQYFHNWANRLKYDNIMAVPPGYIVYGELMYIVHTIYYNRLPDYFIVFDVWNGRQYMDRESKEEFCKEFGFQIIPLIVQGHFEVKELYSLIPKVSSFGNVAEGIVVKRYREFSTRRNDYMRGKVVKKEFLKFVEENEHWTREKMKVNSLDKRISI